MELWLFLISQGPATYVLELKAWTIMSSCHISFLYKTLIAIYIYLIEIELLHILIMLLLKWLFYPFIEIQYSLYVNFIPLKFTLWCVTCILNSFICSYIVFSLSFIQINLSGYRKIPKWIKWKITKGSFVFPMLIEMGQCSSHRRLQAQAKKYF